MKTRIIFLSLFIFALISARLNAQKYQKMLTDSNEWTCFIKRNNPIQDAPRLRYTYKYYTLSPITINGNSYHPLMLYDFFPYYEYCTRKKTDTIGYLREDTLLQRVYFLNKKKKDETLLYDFSLKVNDSFMFHFEQDTCFYRYQYAQTGKYALVEISEVDTYGVKRRVFKFANGSPIEPFIWYEGIGSLKSPCYNLAPFYESTDEESITLNCGFQNQKMVYHIDNNGGNCEFYSDPYGSISQPSPSKLSYFYACYHTFYAGLKGFDPNQISIHAYDMAGRQMAISNFNIISGFSAEPGISFNLPYTPGVYLVNIVAGGYSFSKKVLIID